MYLSLYLLYNYHSHTHTHTHTLILEYNSNHSYNYTFSLDLFQTLALIITYKFAASLANRPGKWIKTSKGARKNEGGCWKPEKGCWKPEKCEVIFKSSEKREREIEAGTKLNIKYMIWHSIWHIRVRNFSFIWNITEFTVRACIHSDSLNLCMHLCVPSVLLEL